MIPVEPAVLGAFAIAAGALVLSPGPDTLIILRYTLSSGKRVGLAAVAGVQMGLMIHTALAIAGISVLIASSPIAFRLVAVAGAAYLGWLGFQSFRGGGLLKVETNSRTVSAARAMRDAILCNVLNPKVIILYLALLPNFVDMGRPDITAQMITLVAVLIGINILWQAPLAWIGEAVRPWLNRPGVHHATGAILMFFAVLLLLEHVF